ncbi:YcaQ family DNA glycosylase [Curtobacterium sp. VKM Ac-2889]|uniref:winged helix-turn-helix domain-containing protein n=1 Tax=unclassified Curtobacterium TaxID=257496 RepID=UPI00188AFDFB|nr:MULTISPECIES: crosslink repair DNA glycosylase YcaQ family protein [unclassified Curtobacterium]MBF4596041.1 YcaQ family DNA glycosylase [Curtobacterium sp. VKM Ac-1796]MBF4611157.1 YcaQ family DNA glycosylase [Curtobacterium sp. VKM Ac-2889]
MPRSTLSAAEARRVALAAQGFGRPPADPVSTRAVNAAFGRLGLLQIDSVNVFERSHYLPLFARLGTYDRSTLDRLTLGRSGPYTEYWAHEAAFIPRDDLRLFRWRMDALRERDAGPTRIDGVTRTAAVRRELHALLRGEGPMPASAVEHESNVRRGPWWGWSDVKLGLEQMFRWGETVSAGRAGFERVYALPEQVLPDGFLETAPARADAVLELVRRASRALGVGTRADIADYYRLRSDDTAAAIAALAAAGELVPVRVEGWGERAWLHADARVPRQLTADAVLSPFDPVVWFRRRAERMYGFHYRIEIYTPAPKRVFGYYVLPVLQDDRLVGRIDLKSDRQRGVLRVRTAWQEPGEHLDPERLAETLRRTASWQGLGAIEVTDRGTAAPAVAGALGLPLVPHVSADDTDAAQPVARAEQDAAVDDAGDAR